MTLFKKASTLAKNKKTHVSTETCHTQTMDTRKSFGTLTRKLFILVLLLLLNMSILFSMTRVYASRKPKPELLAQADAPSITNGNLTSSVSILNPSEEIIVPGRPINVRITIDNSSETEKENIILKQDLDSYMTLSESWIILNTVGNLSLIKANSLVSGVSITLLPKSSVTLDYTLYMDTIPDDFRYLDIHTTINDDVFSNKCLITNEPVDIDIFTNQSNTFYNGESIDFVITLTNQTPIKLTDMPLVLEFDKDTLLFIEEPIGSWLPQTLTLEANETKSIAITLKAPDLAQIYLNGSLKDQKFSTTLTRIEKSERIGKTK